MYGGKTGLYLIEVEKVIPLYDKRFEQMKNHPLDDCPEIIENRDLMYMEGSTAHCILFLDNKNVLFIRICPYRRAWSVSDISTTALPSQNTESIR